MLVIATPAATTVPTGGMLVSILTAIHIPVCRRSITCTICIVFSFQVVDADAAVIGMVVSVRTWIALSVLNIVRLGIEEAFAAGTGPGCCLEVLETLGHALFSTVSLSFMAWRREKDVPSVQQHSISPQSAQPMPARSPYAYPYNTSPMSPT